MTALCPAIVFCRLKEWHRLPGLVAAGWELPKLTAKWEEAYQDRKWAKLHNWSLRKGPNLQRSSDPGQLLELITSYVTTCAWEDKTPRNLGFIKERGSSLAGKDEESFTKLLEDAAAASVRLRSSLQLCIPIAMHAVGCAGKALLPLHHIRPYLERCSKKPILIAPYNIPQYIKPAASIKTVTSEVAAAAMLLSLHSLPSFLSPRVLARPYLPKEQQSDFDAICLEMGPICAPHSSACLPTESEVIPVIKMSVILSSTTLQVPDACSNTLCLHMYGPSTELKVGKALAHSAWEHRSSKAMAVAL